MARSAVKVGDSSQVEKGWNNIGPGDASCKEKADIGASVHICSWINQGELDPMPACQGIGLS